MRDEILNLANLKYYCDAIRVGDLSAAACTHSFALAIVPACLKRFREEHPAVKVNFCLDQ